MFLYVLNAICSAGQSSLGKQYALNGGNSNIFNINKLFFGALVFLIIGIITGIDFHFYTLLYGICYGAFLCISMHTGFSALALGPMALTSIIASFSLLIPFIFGITVFNEKISFYNIIGIVFLLFSIVLLNARREKGFSSKWFVYALLTMLANGACSLVQKYHQTYFNGEYTIEFTVYSFLTAFIILSLFQAKYKYKFSLYGLVAGIMNALSSYITLCLSGAEKASTLFPLISIINILAVWLTGRVIFHERLKKVQIFGLIAGITAVALLKL